MIEKIFIDDKEIMILGTAHVSKESAKEVIDLITAEKPDTVCVELCQSRFQSIKQQDSWQNMDIIKVIKEKKVTLLLVNLLLASFQRKIAKKFDIRAGEEMIKAVETAEAFGINICLADRDVRTTLLRTWKGMGFKDKFKLMFQISTSVLSDLDDVKEEDIEKMKKEDMLEMILKEVGESFPALKNFLIDERDKYLSNKIKTASGNKIVAIVGAGHVTGIKKYLNQDINISDLEQIPKSGKMGIFFNWFFPALIIVLFVVGFFYGGSQVTAGMAIYWVLTTGIMAAIGACLAFAHPLTILASFISAPITAIHPMIAVGWVAGLVEAFLRKPKVKDFENLSQDIMSIKGFWKNSVTRILLIVVFTNLTTTIGTFTAIPLMLKMLN